MYNYKESVTTREWYVVVNPSVKILRDRTALYWITTIIHGGMVVNQLSNYPTGEIFKADTYLTPTPVD